MSDRSCCDVDLVGGLGERARELAVVGFGSLWRGEPLPIGSRTEVVAAMSARGRCEIDGATVVGIHGLTLRPTRHRFVHAGAAHRTWCAFDAVAIPAALGLDAVAFTDCCACGQSIEVQVRTGTPAGGPELVLWLPDATGVHLMDSFCAAADLFCSRQHLVEHVGRDAQGEIVDLERAAELGRETWADVVGVELG